MRKFQAYDLFNEFGLGLIDFDAKIAELEYCYIIHLTSLCEVF